MTDPEQLPLPLPVRSAAGRADFFVSDANRAALAEIERWRDWPQPKLVLTGAAGSGKSHLASVWAEMADATHLSAQGADSAGDGPVVLDDMPAIAGDHGAEQAVFHLHERLMAAGHAMLFVGRAAPGRWGLVLPDLASRVNAAGRAHIDAPDDALIQAVLVKHFDDRQLIVPPNVITYLARRIGRALDDVADVVDRLDRAALAQGRRVTRQFAADVLDHR